ncbi:GyrI-like domain-containing protein [Flavobacterium branchiophilum]|uniref:GyrI-like small molecule binding domain-containing protein n=2 Tax=Flavobacterium branchiophilum TaxID=55197 RepID=G2Z0N8_FLABF|nr:GyrI-like domain-containing protein [Flavobacterium branchiophilum]PDS26278.1 transcriptional regulator [Flavobacterium branchiophilum]CCB69444.1 Protein of unknown function precursor [Flavobacterium branchiophilum FL-15]
MKILKYFFLLIMLLVTAASIFVATLNPNYVVVRTKIIKTPRITAYQYINDLRNWEEFGSWKEDNPNMQFDYSVNSSGKGSYYNWKNGNDFGRIETVSNKEGMLIVQKMNDNGEISDVFWQFKDTLGKTKITFKNIGKMGFSNKIFTGIQGGIDHVVGTIFERSLENVNRILDFEVNTYKVKINGYIQKSFFYYLQKTIISKDVHIKKNIPILIHDINQFSQKNNIHTVGIPFIKYNKKDPNRQVTSYTVGIELKEMIYTSKESEFVVDSLPATHYIKTTLTGDYSHLYQAKMKTLNFIYKNKLMEDFEKSYLEYYVKDKSISNNPSTWITEIYVPIKTKAKPKKYYKPKVEQTTATPAQAPATTETVTPTNTNSN